MLQDWEQSLFCKLFDKDFLCLPKTQDYTFLFLSFSCHYLHDSSLFNTGEDLIPVTAQAGFDSDMSRAAIDASLKTLASGKQLFQVFAYEGFVAFRQGDQRMELLLVFPVNLEVLKALAVHADLAKERIQPYDQRGFREGFGKPGQAFAGIAKSLPSGND